ncbi:glycosyltransferase [Neiella marina]|uniref:Glycosyltransferase n=1 Tax=Neiella holothuriorum TaxID=2870530 RepID=A0ABS7EFX5_9GAMM|nr:glycosyltransferase [Neiella holothuriorum]MBW8190691.1 glycosyltransferase [Neiella holothuriorum]
MATSSSKPMRVLHLEAGRHLYGGAQQVFYILQALQHSDIEYYLACPPGSDIAQSASAVAQVLEVPMNGDIDVGLVFRLARLIKQHQIDLLHVQSRRGADLFGLLAAKKAGIRAIVSRRVDNTEPGWFARWKYHGYQQVITISEGIRQVLLSEGVQPEHVKTIRSAVDTDKFQPDETASARLKKEFELPQNSLNIGVIAQLIERKGHHTLLHALPEILQQLPQVNVIFFGKGPEQAKLREMVNQFGLTSKVHFAGFRTDMPSLLPGLDLVVHPAFKEGLGVSLLQASACGVPVIAGRAGGIPEAVRDDVNGYLMTPGEIPELTALILKVMADHELRSKLGQQGRQLMLDEFSIQVMAEGNEAVYRQLLSLKD